MTSTTDRSHCGYGVCAGQTMTDPPCGGCCACLARCLAAGPDEDNGFCQFGRPTPHARSCRCQDCCSEARSEHDFAGLL